MAMDYIEEHTIDGDGSVPNSRLPLLIYRGAGPARSALPSLRENLRRNQWTPDWLSTNGMYPRHHFHSDAHEFIVVVEGELTCRLGGEHGISAHLHKGDAVVIPAGVAHCGDQISERLVILGAFPAGFGFHDFRLGYASEYAEMALRASRVPIPAFDPLFGVAGPLVRRWTGHS